MYVELDTTDLLNLVHSTQPSYALQQTEEMLQLGRYSQAFDRWVWNDKVKAMSQESLFELYIQCKNTK